MVGAWGTKNINTLGRLMGTIVIVRHHLIGRSKFITTTKANLECKQQRTSYESDSWDSKHLPTFVCYKLYPLPHPFPPFLKEQGLKCSKFYSLLIILLGFLIKNICFNLLVQFSFLTNKLYPLPLAIANPLNEKGLNVQNLTPSIPFTWSAC